MISIGTRARWLCLAFVFVAQSALAFFDAPYITPSNPVAGEQLTVNIGQGYCDAVASEPGYPQVTQQGNAIRVLLFALRYESAELCFLPVATARIQFGSFPAGSYTVRVDVFYYDGHGEPQTATLGNVPVTVSGAAQPPVPAPAIGVLALSVLFAALALGAIRRLAVLLLIACLCGGLPSRVLAGDLSPRTVEFLLSSAPGAQDPLPFEVLPITCTGSSS